MVASSIFIFFLVSLYLGKRYYSLLFAMIGIHFSSILLLFGLAFKKIYAMLALTILCVFILLTNENLFSYAYPLLPNFDSDYVRFALSHIKGAASTYDDDGSVPIYTYIVSISIILFGIYMSFYRNRKDLLVIFYPFVYSFLLFNIFFPIQLLWLRFSFYQYAFYFIFFAFIFQYLHERFKWISVFYILISILLLLNFIMYFDSHVWTALVNHGIVNIFGLDIFKQVGAY